MASFPFFPFSYRNYYSRYYQAKNPNTIPNSFQSIPRENSINTVNSNSENKTVSISQKLFGHKNKSSKYNPFASFNFSTLLNSNLNEPVLEVLGMYLYLDDLLIIGILFFLYTEGVQDEILFITLILLLLS